jgi:RNase P/RNase MRP subunit POP5
MAGFKHRYLVIKVNSKIETAIASNIKNILLRNMKTNFGDFILSLIETFEIVENYENLSIIIIRCNLAIYKYLCHTIISIGKINDNNVRLTILNVSGILKKAKKKLLSSIKKEETTV